MIKFDNTPDSTDTRESLNNEAYKLIKDFSESGVLPTVGTAKTVTPFKERVGALHADGSFAEAQDVTTTYYYSVKPGEQYLVNTMAGYNTYEFYFMKGDSVVSKGHFYVSLTKIVKVIEIPDGVDTLVVPVGYRTLYSHVVAKIDSQNVKFSITSSFLNSNTFKYFTYDKSTMKKLTPDRTETGKYVSISMYPVAMAGYNIAYYDLKPGHTYVVRGVTVAACALYQLITADKKVLDGYPFRGNNRRRATIVEKTIYCPSEGYILAVNYTGDFNCGVYESTEDSALIPMRGRYSNGNLYGKIWACCGDSFTSGDWTGQTDTYKDPDTQIALTYAQLISDRNNMDLWLIAQGGQDMTAIEGATNPFSKDTSTNHYKHIPANADYVTICFGLNETGLTAAQIGTKTDSTNATLWGAYNIVFEHILTNNPCAKIGVIIPDGWMYTYTNYIQAVKDICDYWSVPVLDLNEYPLQKGTGLSDKSDKAAQLRNGGMMLANSHPNAKGHEHRSTIIENWMQSL